MKVKIMYGDEWYPVFSIVQDSNYGSEIDLTEEEIAFIKEAQDNFYKAQSLMGDKLPKAKRWAMTESGVK